ncbi:tyrosine-type recombinase/integrase [Mycobacterium colombiense]|uniref:tyrosine-type recombinase/integrase n=1 Tax=Mycobacterium colombiense TaxID=339268 RepID=UPI0007FEA5B6|nr:tyrosine-type recombinase/integrase [Mycobacterium colombiense]OBJ21664.1 recombinase XerD [Mycobacterium colombiense]
MARQQLPPQIKKITITDRSTGKAVVRYQVTADAGADPVTGKRRQVRRRYPSEREAKDALAKIADQAATGTFVARKTVTVGALCEEWLESLHHARASTIVHYGFVLAPLRERFGSFASQKLTRVDLDKLLTDLRDGGTRTAEGNARRAWSARSLNAAIDAWRLVLEYGCQRRDLAYNVAAGMKKVARQRREMQTYTPEEISAVLRAADKDRNGHLWYLALSGLRRCEIAGLKWSDIKMDAGILTVARNRVQVGAATVVENQPKTQSSRRMLPIDAGLVAVLKRASARQTQERLALGADYAATGYVAVNEAGQPYTPGALTNMWHRLTKAAEVRPIRLHDARHSCGTALHLRGVPMAVIAKWLGHADASVTARIYAHSQDDALKAASTTLGQVVTPAL